jgi:prepilin-type N-terminal cleavage/methylation domain-containing protein/prepilin-type processing-associated H-X9-DG protein
MTSIQRAKAGFTLVELLVVIGIIAVMVAILLPALGKARKQAQATVCLSNLRQLGIAVQQYTFETNDGNMMANPTLVTRDNNGNVTGLARPTGIWMRDLLPYIWPSIKRMSDADLRRQSPISGLLCPSAPSPNYDGNWFGIGTAVNSWSDQAIGSVGPFTSSYAYNGRLYRYHTALANVNNGNPYAWSEAYARSLMQDFSSPQPTRIPLLVDAIWGDMFPNDTETLDLVDSAYSGSPTNNGWTAGEVQIARAAIARHGRAVNVVFMDGHTERVPIENLATLKWTKSWNRTTPYRLPAVLRDAK